MAGSQCKRSWCWIILGTLLFLVCKLVVKSHFTEMVMSWYPELFSHSYNAFKFQLQHGNLDQQLSAASHLLCATCAGT